MCGVALIWSGIKTLVYGYSITEAIAEGRKRIDLTCRELFARAQAGIEVQACILHSRNFCPTLEACKILELDTREICRVVNEKPMDGLIKQISGQLEFGRNYQKIRPYCDYCEEMIFSKGIN